MSKKKKGASDDRNDCKDAKETAEILFIVLFIVHHY